MQHEDGEQRRGEEEVTLDSPADRFYVSVAPYAEDNILNDGLGAYVNTADATELMVVWPVGFVGPINTIAQAFDDEQVKALAAYVALLSVLSLGRDDKLANLYFVGAGTHPGAGIPGVVGSAKATAGLMLEDLAA